MDEMIQYSGKYLNLTRDALILKVSEQMSEKRFQHVLGVETTAIALAKKYGVDIEKASIAALVHDYAKERSDDSMIEWIHRGAFSEDLIEYGNAIWHGIVGAEIVCKELGIEDQAILDSIRLHTTGAKDMEMLSKIIFVADYIEPSRTFSGVEQARQLAFENLDGAVAFELYHTLQFLLKNKTKIYPKTIEAYNYWVINNQEEL